MQNIKFNSLEFQDSSNSCNIFFSHVQYQTGKHFEFTYTLSEFTLMFMIKVLSYKWDTSILESRNNDRDKILLVLNKDELGVWIDDSLIVSSEIPEQK